MRGKRVKRLRKLLRKANPHYRRAIRPGRKFHGQPGRN